MPRLTPNTAHDLAQRYGIPLGRDFHTLSQSDKALVLEAARERRYRTPHNAPGSRARMFYQHLNRIAT